MSGNYFCFESEINWFLAEESFKELFLNSRASPSYLSFQVVSQDYFCFESEINLVRPIKVPELFEFWGGQSDLFLFSKWYNQLFDFESLQ